VENYKTDLSSYTLKLHDQSNPKKVQAANSKYKEVSSLKEVKATKESYFFDTKKSILYVNVPASEDKKVQIKF
ncbi:hypothetical protein R0K17_28975, partial [Planococcus sp. SIMBA_143]